MAQGYYDFRILIVGEQVVVNCTSPSGNTLGDSSGALKFDAARLQAIGEFLAVLDKQPDRPNRDVVNMIGRLLFEGLLSRTMHSKLDELYEQARASGDVVRVSISFDDEGSHPALAALPWEFLRPPSVGDQMSAWLATESNYVVVRRPRHPSPARPIRREPGQPLRIALIVSSPSNKQHVGGRTYGRVLYEGIEETLKKLEREHPGQVQVSNLLNANLESIDSLLETTRPHIVHFAGHGRLYDESQQPAPAVGLIDPRANDLVWRPADEFAEKINSRAPLALVVLHACEGAAADSARAFTSVAAALVAQNIPMVVAMQFEIQNKQASLFSTAFYRRLAQGLPVDRAVQEGRRAISNQERLHETRDFAAPVLFSRLIDMQLLELKRLPAALAARAPVNRIELAPDQQTSLRAALIAPLLNFPRLQDRNARLMLLNLLPDVQAAVDATAPQEQAVDMILAASLETPDGLDRLVDMLRALEGDNELMGALDAVLDKAMAAALIPSLSVGYTALGRLYGLLLQLNLSQEQLLTLADASLRRRGASISFTSPFLAVRLRELAAHTLGSGLSQRSPLLDFVDDLAADPLAAPLSAELKAWLAPHRPHLQILAPPPGPPPTPERAYLQLIIERDNPREPEPVTVFARLWPERKPPCKWHNLRLADLEGLLQKLFLYFEAKHKNDLTIEVWLAPADLLSLPVESWYKEPLSEDYDRPPVGIEHPVVLRALSRVRQSENFQPPWRMRWDQWQRRPQPRRLDPQDILRIEVGSIDNSTAIYSKIREHDVFCLLELADQRVLGNLLRSGLPFILFARPEPGILSEKDITDLLGSGEIEGLPQRVLSRRQQGFSGSPLPLKLVWDEPERLPPSD